MDSPWGPDDAGLSFRISFGLQVVFRCPDATEWGQAVDSCKVWEDLLFDHLFVSLLKMRMFLLMTGSVQNCCQIIAMFVHSSFYVEWIQRGILSGCPLPGFMWTRCKSWISSIFAHPKIDGLSLLPLLLPLLHVTLQKSAGIDATPEGFSRFQCWWSLEYAGPIDNQIQLIWGRPLRDGIVPRPGELFFQFSWTIVSVTFFPHVSTSLQNSNGCSSECVGDSLRVPCETTQAVHFVHLPTWVPNEWPRGSSD